MIRFHGTGYCLLVKHTYAQNLEAGDTIYTIMTDEEQMAAKFIGIGRDYVQLYKPLVRLFHLCRLAFPH